ncbi:MAG: hypothetical protein ACE10E_03125 [Acidiferrobacterales bacterium]|nr:hypothetical protein [Nitrospirota bacterium]
MTSDLEIDQSADALLNDQSRHTAIEAGNRDYQQELDISLIGSMGVERAVRACQANGCDGVLEKVLCYRGNGKTPS